MKKIVIFVFALLATLSCKSQGSDDASTFSVVVDGDIVDFKVLGTPGTVSLTAWNRSNFDNHVLCIPGRVNYQGTDYSVVEIGDEALGGWGYSTSIWSGDHQVDSVVLPATVKRLGDHALASSHGNRYAVALTDSVESLGVGAVYCASICDGDYAVILPARARYVGWLLDEEDNEDDRPQRYSKLYIPADLEYIGGLEEYSRNQPLFECVEVHPDNTHYKAINGTLYSYGLDTLYLSTMQPDLYIPAALRFDEDLVSFLGEGWYPHLQMPDFTSVTVQEGNPWCQAIDNVVYDLNHHSLIFFGNKAGATVHVPAWCNRVSAIYQVNLPATFIFDDEATDQDVRNFEAQLLDYAKFDDEIQFTFVHKGRCWTH